MMRRSRSGLSLEDKRGIAIFGTGLLILIALVVVVVRAINSPDKAYDPTTLCNKQLPRNAHHLLIIDVSDSLSPHQQHFLRSHISGLLEAASVNDRFSLFVLDERLNGLSDPVVDLCKPRSVEGANALTSNRFFIESLYRDRFEAPLESAIASVVASGEQKVSPIYEALADVAALRRVDPRARDISLTIVSDMIQNSRAGSVFDAGPRAIDELPMVDLRGVKTKVLWLDREKYKRYQTSDLASSWEDYLGSVSRFEQIERVRD